MKHTVIYDKGTWDGYGNFQCSVCGKDVFIQYDSYEKESTGRLTVWRGKCYCLCDNCIDRCMDVGKAKFLKDAKSYEETKEEPYEEPEWMKKIDPQYKSIAGMLPAVALFGWSLLAHLSDDKREEFFKKLEKK